MEREIQKLGKTHKKAALLAVLAAAALAGTVFALFPAWERHRCEEKQEAMLSRLELSVPEIQAFEEPLETVKACLLYTSPSPRDP